MSNFALIYTTDFNKQTETQPTQSVNKIFILLCLVHAICFQAASKELTDTVAEEHLHEVTVVGQSARQRMSLVHLGAENLEMAKMKTLPSFLGENDIIKSITLLPGVHGEGDGAGGFEVRGGTSAQNHVTLDGITLYNPSHVMGIFSTFNDDAISRATLYKGPIPAQFGDGTASVLETSLAAGDMEEYHASATIGLLIAKIKGEGPIVKDRLSFAVSARRSYVDAFISMMPQYRGTVMNFYDITAKARYIPRPGDFLDVSFIMGHDNLAIKDVMGMYWGNIGISANWQARCGEKLVFTTTASYTDYSPEMSMSIMMSDQHLHEYVHTASLNERIRYRISDNHSFEAGARTELLRINSAEMEYNGRVQKDIRSGWANAIWLNYDGTFAEKISLSAGIRMSMFSTLTGNRFNHFAGPEEEYPSLSAKTYLSPEPRISLKYDINTSHNIKLGASITSQNMHSIRSSSTSFPFDRYAITSATVHPEKCTQYVAGYTGMTQNGDYDWSVEGYYKDMSNVYDYMDGRTMFSQVNLENIILGGKGRSYGAELMLRKNTGPLTGWIAYTLSKTTTRIPGINGGRWYNATNDRRHDISVTAIYRFNDRWSTSGAWIYSSGQPLTAPDVKYEISGTTCYYYSQRNGYRTPSTHRLDLSATYTREGKRFITIWNFGFYNTYCRYNPYIIYFEDDPTNPAGTRAVLRALFGLIPSVSYTLKF